MTHTPWKVIQSTDVSPSKWFPIIKDEVELPNGKHVEYFKSKLGHVAMVVAITKQKEIIFVRQYKHGIGEVCIEFPAGRIENGKTAQQTAVAELREETGILVDESQLRELGELWAEPSKSTVRVYGFFVENVEITTKQNLEETEDIEILRVPLRELNDFIEKIHASDTLALLTLIYRIKYKIDCAPGRNRTSINCSEDNYFIH
jgi:ADP-ribose pyrophosphatase